LEANTEPYSQFAHMLQQSEKIVFFGGAGVSTESGLKDYRSPDGIYHTAQNYGMPPEEILSRGCFDTDPALFYRFFRDYFTGQAQPCRAHKALALLEQHGKQVTVVTQNIDGLHQKAGSSYVLELHGSSNEFFCRSCRKRFGTECLAQPGVPRCSCGGIIKPKVTLYGEMLDEQVIDRAISAIAGADILIIGGTSLAVQPAASFVRYYSGSRLVIINKEATGYDANANLVFHESIGDVFDKAFEQLNRAGT